MSTPYTDLKFTKSQIRILKRFRRMGKVPVEVVEKHKNGKYKFLYKYSLIDYADKSRQYFALSDKGVMFLLYHGESKYRFYLSTILSVVAIIISIIALLKQ